MNSAGANFPHQSGFGCSMRNTVRQLDQSTNQVLLQPHALDGYKLVGRSLLFPGLWRAIDFRNEMPPASLLTAAPS